MILITTMRNHAFTRIVNIKLKACSSVAERCYDMAEVGGSIPSTPTSLELIAAKDLK